MTEALLQKCTAFADRYAMLPAAGEKLLCAVSGGADSVCLLLLMRRLAEMRGFSLACAHYDHRLRGEESRRDAEYVRALCERLGVAFVLGEGEVREEASARGCGIEETAREMRYAFLEETARALGAAKIATAHNADDNAETMLLNLARGAGSRGLAGIPPKRGRFVRPLLCAERGEIEAFLRGAGESWVTDSSNLTDDYARNRLRHGATPVLREINPAFALHALAAAERLRADEEYFVTLAEEFLQRHAVHEGESLSLPAEELNALPKPVCARVLRLVCGEALSAQHVDALYALLLPGKSGAAADVPGMRVVRSFDRLVFGAEETACEMPERELIDGGEVYLPECGLAVRRTDGVPCEIHNSFNIFYFKMTKPCGRITIRSKQPGDSLRLPGRGCTKSLKKLLAEARVPAAKRGAVPVIADEQGPLAVVGFGVDERRTARPGELSIKIELRKREVCHEYDAE